MASDDLLGGQSPIAPPDPNRKPWASIPVYLMGLAFPATKQAIIAKLRSRGGLDEALARAETIPDREYKNDEDVRAAFEAAMKKAQGSQSQT
ncbi:DUF2795 domain-containing protein [Streptomyces sp. ISL-14]|nr:DUF2795 domain-containing protein [Streptomyces sp. ISL-14]